MPNSPTPKPEPCGACGERLTEALFRYPRVMYQGREVIFCTVDCLKQYQKDPDAFMAGKIVHTNSNKRTQVLSQ
jgi:YHS domain-containing protein